MELYGQDAEVLVLSRLIRHLTRPILVDVGAERGDVAAELLRAGIQTAHVFEPHPSNIAALEQRFGADRGVTVHPLALSDSEGAGELHVSVGEDGAGLPFGHTLIERSDTNAIKWRGTVPVEIRTLGSIVDSGEVPREVGILKVDTEGSDLAVIRGLGRLNPDIAMVEHWSELPEGLGTCPWTAAEMAGELRTRGFNHFVEVIHDGEFVTFAWDDAEIERGAMGNLIFLHDRILERALPDLLRAVAELARQAVELGAEKARAAEERLGIIDGLARTAQERLDLIHHLEAAAAQRLRDGDAAREQAERLGVQLAAGEDRIRALEDELAAMRALSS